ncbi:MAG: right-handed parallel beta-helix repeat-containing protein [Candidatus Thorarchaeota archaeon]
MYKRVPVTPLLIFTMCVTFFLSAGLATNISLQSEHTDNLFVSNLQSSEPIIITSESQFVNYAISEGLEGSGTESNPYIIIGLSFYSDTTCITIRTTETYFIIRDCTFSSPEATMGTGVEMTYASNGLIENCSFTNLRYGVRFSHSRNSKVTNCEFSEIYDHAVEVSFYRDFQLINNTINNSKLYQTPGSSWMYSGAVQINGLCQGSIITDNTVKESSWVGLWVSSDDITVENNILEDCSFGGLVLNNADQADIHNNLIEDNSAGMIISSVYDSILSNNVIINNTGPGIDASSFGRSLITENLVRQNSHVGVFLSFDSSNNSIYGNAIWHNERGNARDNGQFNIWDDGIGLGNSWSNHAEGGEYQILGTAGNVDRYPATDLDRDGLSDVIEIELGTDLFNVDSDGDTISDSWEYLNGYDPKNPELTILEFLHFNLGSLTSVGIFCLEIVGVLLVVRLVRKKAQEEKNEEIDKDDELQQAWDALVISDDGECSSSEDAVSRLEKLQQHKSR